MWFSFYFIRISPNGLKLKFFCKNYFIGANIPEATNSKFQVVVQALEFGICPN